MTTNCFAETWDFWRVATLPIAQLQRAYGIAPLAPEGAADEDAPAGYQPMA